MMLLMCRFITEFHTDMTTLNCLQPSNEPKATDYIPQMITMIEDIMKSGHAYEAEGSVWFSIESIEAYGRLSGRTLVSDGSCTCSLFILPVLPARLSQENTTMEEG